MNKLVKIDLKPIPVKIKIVPVLFLFLCVGMCSAGIGRFVSPIVVEKQIMRVDTLIIEKKVEVVKEKVIKEKVYPIKELMGMVKPSTSTTSVERLHGYTPFEIAIYFLKAYESFRPWEYPDGDYNSKGFGLNLNPDHVKWATKQLGFPCRSRNWTYNEGTKLLYNYYQEMKDGVRSKHPNINEFQLVALLLHKYNTGNTKSIYACCNAKKGCGSKNRDIRKAHNERRRFETRLYANKVTLAEIEYYKQEAIKTDAKWKNY